LDKKYQFRHICDYKCDNCLPNCQSYTANLWVLLWRKLLLIGNNWMSSSCGDNLWRMCGYSLVFVDYTNLASVLVSSYFFTREYISVYLRAFFCCCCCCCCTGKDCNITLQLRESKKNSRVPTKIKIIFKTLQTTPQ
jgi:hypothetical protein